MKRAIFFLAAIITVSVNAQSLKDALYSGRLKTDTGTVLKKGDDLSSKIDTTSRVKPVEAVKLKTVTPGRDSAGLVNKELTVRSDAPATTGTEIKDNNTVAKDNNRIWKDYIDSVISTVKTEVLPSKKIKGGAYYLLVEYEIGTEGQVNINNVSCSPENSFLQQQVKDRLNLTPPQMNPVLASNGKPRKVTRKYNLTLSKAD